MVNPISNQRLELDLLGADGRYAIEVSPSTTMQRKLTSADGAAAPESALDGMLEGLDAIKSGMAKTGPAADAPAAKPESLKEGITQARAKKKAAKQPVAPAIQAQPAIENVADQPIVTGGGNNDSVSSLAALRESIKEREKFADLQPAMRKAKWFPEVAEPDNTIWTRVRNSRLYTASLNPESGSMEITVPEAGVNVQIASFSALDSADAAVLANKAIATDIAERAEASGIKRSNSGFAEVKMHGSKHFVTPYNDLFVIRDARGVIAKTPSKQQMFFATEAEAIEFANENSAKPLDGVNSGAAAAPALTSYTPADIQSQQQAQQQAAKADAAAKRAEDAAATEADNRKRIAAASVAAADSFELGQDPLDSLTGQKDVFADAVSEAEAAKSGPFGPILTQYRHDAQGAIKALTALQDGEAVAALHHPEVGDIDLVWGKEGTSNSDGLGLAKLVKWHPEVLSDLQGLLNRLNKDPAQSGKNRTRLVDEKGTAVVRLQWNGDAKNWLLTAFESAPGGATRTDTGTTSTKDDTASLGTEGSPSLPTSPTGGKPTNLKEGIAAAQDKAQQGQPTAQAQQAQAATETAADKPAAKRKLPPKLAAKAAEAEAQRAAYFAPGNVVASYTGHDRVVAYTPADAQGNWSVTVQPVEQQGDKWVDVPNSKPRTHSTQPDARAMRAGPVVVAKAQQRPATEAVIFDSALLRAKAAGVIGVRAGMSNEALAKKVKAHLAGERAARHIAAGKKSGLPQYQGVSEDDARVFAGLIDANPYALDSTGATWALGARGMGDMRQFVSGGLLENGDARYKHALTGVGKEIARRIASKPAGDASIEKMLTEIELASASSAAPPTQQQDTPKFSRAGGGNTEAAVQLKETERAYGGREAYNQAKAAGKTKLTYGQWVQVRTPNFKAWFGDWEGVRAQARLDAMKPLQVRVPSEWRELSHEGLRQKMAVELDRMVREKTEIKHPDLGAIRVGRAGAKKSEGSARDPAKSLVAADIEALIPASIYARSSASHGGDGPDIAGYSTLLVRVDVDGIDLVASFTVRHQSDGQWYYNAVALHDAKEKAQDSYERPDQQAGSSVAPIAGLSDFIRRKLERVNPDNVSKVADPDTGEPLVVYHGTASDFDAFEIDGPIQNALRTVATWAAGKIVEGLDPDVAGERRAAFFTRSPYDASIYATSNRRKGGSPNVMPVYLAIKSPLVVDGATGKATAPNGNVIKLNKGANTNALISLAIQSKADGLLLRNVADVFTGADGADIFLAFRHNQIKSATGNNGNFAANPDIRSSFAGQQAVTADTHALASAQQRLDAGTALVDKAGATMEQVVAAIDRVTQLMGEISAASREQAQGVSQVGEAVQQMDLVTQQNAALVEEMAAEADSLRSQAADLVQVVAVFQLGGTERGGQRPVALLSA